MHRLVVAALMVAASVMGGVSYADHDEGLPHDALVAGDVGAEGVAEVVRSRQWVPLGHNRIRVRANAQPDGTLLAQLYVVSPGKSPRKYGHLRDLNVKTVAFGIIPVRATVTLQQLRKRNGDVVPWTLTAENAFSEDARMTGEVRVRLADLRLDGRPVWLGRNCSPDGVATLELDAEKGYSALSGGKMTGTIDVPRFSGCGSSEMSRLLTSMVSGDGQRVEVCQSPPTGNDGDELEVVQGDCSLPKP